jgi:hypothetical protein
VSDDRRSSRRPGPDAFGHFTCICASTAPCYDVIVVRRPDWANRLWSDQAPERAPGKATRWIAIHEVTRHTWHDLRVVGRN